TKAYKSGSTLPVKLQVVDAGGANRSAAGLVVTARGVRHVSPDAGGTLEDAGNANPDDNFRFDPTLGGSGGYVFNLKTTGFATGTYELTFTVGSEPYVYSVQ